MRSILLVSSRHVNRDGIERLVSDSFSNAILDQVDCAHVKSYLQSGVCPDLIIYAPRSIKCAGSKFLQIKSLASSARILVYSSFRKAEQRLFDYLAIGVNGILATNTQLVEHRRALDTVMRGDSFVDVTTRNKMLAAKNLIYGMPIREEMMAGILASPQG